MHQVAVRLQERDIEILGLVAQFPHISADALTRFVMPEAYWKLAHTHSFDAQQRHRVTRPVRERMATLSKAGLVTIHTDAMGRAAYGVTQKGSEFAELSPRWVGAPVAANAHTLDVLQQALAITSGVGWRFVFRRGCVIERAVIVRGDHGASPLQRAEVERVIATTNATGLIAVARAKDDAERVRRWAADLGLLTAVARGDVLPSGYYEVTGLNRPSAQGVINHD